MHHCLQLPEITHTIFQYLDDNELFQTCLTCHDFNEVALNVLWKELTSLTPLLHALPSIFSEPTGGDDDSEKSRSLGAMSRFKTKYGQRIRTIDLHRNETDKKNLLRDLFASLYELESGILTPNLTKLSGYSECHYAHRALFPTIEFFLAPTIKNISLHLLPDEDKHQNILKKVVDLYEGLESLRVSFNPLRVEESTVDEIGRAVIPLNNLLELSINHLPKEAIEHVASLPNLRTLYLSDFQHIDCLYNDLKGIPHIRPIERAFPALSELHGVTIDIINAIGLLQYLSPQTPLSRLSLSHTPFEEWIFVDGRSQLKRLYPNRSWQRVLNLARAHCNAGTLKWLSLCESDYTEPDEHWAYGIPVGPAEGDIEDLDISPLFVFHNLQTLELSLAHGAPITKDNVRRMAEVWKSVTWVDLFTKYPSYRSPMIDHEDLVNLVKGCPKLWGLGLIFDATRMPSEPTLLAPKPIKRFQQLTVGNTLLGSVSATSEFLKMHFPRLATISPISSSPGASDWVQVEANLREAIRIYPAQT
ncbi:hypothetical protein D9611_009526 [Ephemerocybe angulata]|uniref:F-box domain-containing protein n=1 Tax=Ephemerocybe angulata TaxID=980116 RepID=A0A8H5ETM7_9AGAR|nr:hypothetical protein D9611_009526 [Tulosesus angulatus]